MPQIKAAKKDLRKNARRRAVNDRWRKKLRASLYAVRDALSGGDASAAAEAARKAQSMLDRAARHNILHARKAARTKERLTRQLAKLS